ncbi:hypothetical protein SBBP1_120007 [Burkholderiales bacterium]|nr:hypothetical protein SBBP1_120007 [Burkholderiales bacterium]
MVAIGANQGACSASVLGAVTGVDLPAKYRLDCIANAALQHAIGRGFIRGYEQEDWINAEAQVLAEMYGLTGSSS